MLLKDGQVVRFTDQSRHGDWVKGEMGKIERVLALPPQNQLVVVIVVKDSGDRVWATDKDVMPWNQLSLC